MVCPIRPPGCERGVHVRDTVLRPWACHHASRPVLGERCQIQRKGSARRRQVHLDVPAQVLVSRTTARSQCGQCGRIYNMLSQPPKVGGICDADQAPLIRREDDTEEVILARLKAYHDATGPVIAYYRGGGCRRVDATGAPAEIAREIERLLAGHAESEAITCPR